jgi:hypothetical protein
MIDWLAVIVICAKSECAFWADVKIPYENKAACEARVVEMSSYFAENGVEPVLATCLPIKFVKV